MFFVKEIKEKLDVQRKKIIILFIKFDFFIFFMNELIYVFNVCH